MIEDLLTGPNEWDLEQVLIQFVVLVCTEKDDADLVVAVATQGQSMALKYVLYDGFFEIQFHGPLYWPFVEWLCLKHT